MKKCHTCKKENDELFFSMQWGRSPLVCRECLSMECTIGEHNHGKIKALYIWNPEGIGVEMGEIENVRIVEMKYTGSHGWSYLCQYDDGSDFNDGEFVEGEHIIGISFDGFND